MKNKINSGRILVTGGAGFIGSAMIWHLNRLGYTNIIVTDILKKDDKWRNLVPLKYEDYYEADEFLSWLEKDEHLLRDMGINTVLHFGACSKTTELDASFLVENNFAYTKILAEAAIRDDARFVYASSAATYGDGSCGMDDKDTNLSKYRPLNMYAYSKQMFDLWAQKRGWLDSIAGLKFFNVYGPNEDHKEDMRSLPLKASFQIKDTGEIGLFKSRHPDYADGMQMRDFLYIKDAVKMVYHIASNDKLNGIYNLGSGKATTWIDLVSPIFKVFGLERNIKFIDMPDSLAGKYQYYTCASIDKLRESGYNEDITSVEDAVTDYVKNYIIPDAKLDYKD